MSFIHFENPLFFRPNLKSIFTYQNGLESKKLFCKMFLKSNFTTKYIRARIQVANQESHRTLLYSAIPISKVPLYFLGFPSYFQCGLGVMKIITKSNETLGIFYIYIVMTSTQNLNKIWIFLIYWPKLVAGATKMYCSSD